MPPLLTNHLLRHSSLIIYALFGCSVKKRSTASSHGVQQAAEVVGFGLCVAVCPSQTVQAQPALHAQPRRRCRSVSSAPCVPSIFQSGRERRRDWRFQCQLSSGLSRVLCQILPPAVLSASKKINPTGGSVGGRRRWGRVFFCVCVFVLRQCHCLTQVAVSGAQT